MKTVFVSPQGIRAGWRLLVFLSIAATSALILGRLVVLSGLRPGSGLTPSRLVVGEGTLFVALIFAAAVMGRIESRSLADYALPPSGAFGIAFWRGALWGFLALTLLLLFMRALDCFAFGSLALSGRAIAYYGGVWAVAFLVVAFFEEFLMRGYALFTLTTGLGFWPSALLVSVLFGAGHWSNSAESWIGVLAAASIGIFFCFTVRRTGSLWFAIGFHAMWDFSESFLYSVPDSGVNVQGHLLNSTFRGPAWLSGGATGPEGSALVFVVIAALFVVFDRLNRQARFPLKPAEKHVFYGCS